jgi:1-phosphofructokinase family hexose kinase
VIVCVSANPSIDKLFEVDRLVAGAIHRPVGFVQRAGGKGLNVARAAASLGADVCAVAMLRGHAGAWIRDALAAEGVPGSFVWTSGETRASLSVADRAEERLTEFYENGEQVPADAWPGFARAVVEQLHAASWLTISGSMPPGSPDDGYAQLVDAARRAGTPVALDAAGAHLERALHAGPDVVKVNRHEAADLLGEEMATEERALAGARELRARAGADGHTGIVTLGAEGVVVVGPDGLELRGHLYERGRYPVGSGDAFLAGLTVGTERSAGLEEALRLALGSAAANAELPGAGRLDPDRAKSLAGSARVVRV